LFLQKIQRAADAGQHAEPEHIDLQNAEIVEIILVPFDHGAFLHGGVLDRHHLVEARARNDKAADMLREVAGKADQLTGEFENQSEPGIGTKFTITLPITLAIISALVLEVARRTYAIPLSTVQEALLFDPRHVRTVEGREVITLRGTTLPICRLNKLFDHAQPEGPTGRQYVVVTGIGTRRAGFVVDALHGQQDIVIKALGRSLQQVRGFAGATDLGDQVVALVLDAPALLDEVLASHEKVHPLGAGGAAS